MEEEKQLDQKTISAIRNSRKCDFCGEVGPEQFVDGATIHGPWAYMCMADFRQHGIGLGTGRGQQYRWENDHYQKVAG